MAQQTILGTDTVGGTGLSKINANFTQLYRTSAGGSVNVADFGAVPGATPAATRQGFQDALDYAAANGYRAIFVPQRGGAEYWYTFDAPITSTGISIIGEHRPRCILYWPAGTVPAGGYAITTWGQGGHEQAIILENLTIVGQTSSPALGSHPANYHGVRLGYDGSDSEMRMNNIEIHSFDYNIVCDNNTGHIYMTDVQSQDAYYGVYVRRGNADYSFINCNFTNVFFAGIGLPRNTGISMAAFWSCHFGFAPYGIFQSNVDDTATAGNRQQGFLFQCQFTNCDFEAIGNGAIYTEAVPQAGNTVAGRFTGNTIRGGWHDFNASYKIAARNKDYFVKTGDTSYNTAEWGSQIWPAGDAGILSYGGIGTWTLRGAAPYPTPPVVVANGEKSYNTLDRTALTPLTVTIGVGQTSATYNYDTYMQAAVLKPVLMPRSDPGGRFWISSNTSTSFTVTREGTTTNAVIFDIQFQ